MTDGKSYGETTPSQDGKTFPEPTPQEAHFFFNILKYQKSKPEIDWAAVAEASGFKNADVAKVRFGQVKKKLGLESGATKSPARAPSKKTAKSANPGDDVLGPNTAGAKIEKKAPRKRAPAKSKVQAQAQAQLQAQAQAQVEAEAQAHSRNHRQYQDQLHDEEHGINSHPIGALEDEQGDMSKTGLSTSSHAKTEDRSAKQEHDHNNAHLNSYGLLEDYHIGLSSDFEVHGLPNIPHYRSERENSPAVDFDPYSYLPDRGHDI